VFPIHCHAALSKTKSQIRIVILREVKRSRRIYRRINDGFCNSRQRRPPCRMTRWMADNEYKDLRFCLIRQLPRIFKCSYELSLLTNGHSARSEAESRISPLSKHQHNSLKLCPPSSIFSLTFKFSCVHSKIQKKVFLQLIQ